MSNGPIYKTDLDAGLAKAIAGLTPPPPPDSLEAEYRRRYGLCQVCGKETEYLRGGAWCLTCVRAAFPTAKEST